MCYNALLRDRFALPDDDDGASDDGREGLTHMGQPLADVRDAFGAASRGICTDCRPWLATALQSVGACASPPLCAVSLSSHVCCERQLFYEQQRHCDGI